MRPDKKKKKIIPLYIYGKNAVDELLKTHPDAIKQVFVHNGSEEQYKKIFPKGMRLQPVHISTLDKHSNKGAHQGIVVELHNFPYLQFDFVLSRLRKNKTNTIIACDHITDPHNVGAIIRSAAAFGCDAIIIEDVHQSPVNSTVIKVSAGTAFHIPIARVASLKDALATLQKNRYILYGLDMHGEDITDPHFTFAERSVFVLGSEGFGMRKEIAQMVDKTIAIPMKSGIESLNVSATAACVCYERQRQMRKS